MVELDVGDDGDLGLELEEAAVGLVGLGDHPFPVAPAGVVGLAAAAPGRSPPRKNAGSAPIACIAWTSIPAVVVLPCVPETAISRRIEQSSASNSPRCSTR